MYLLVVYIFFFGFSFVFLGFLRGDQQRMNQALCSRICSVRPPGLILGYYLFLFLFFGSIFDN